MRHLTPYAQHSKLVKDLLDKLANRGTSEQEYAASFYEIGKTLTAVLFETHALANKNVMLACSSEDADWLSKGILDSLTENGVATKLAVFWNSRQDLNADIDSDLAIAPIIRSYIEPADSVDYLIICKSIISSSCVVRTNITYLIEKIDPLKILILSPVLFEKAIPNLKREFPSKISNKFEFVYFAEDTELNASNEVIPGIGGSVYTRLGLVDAAKKNKYIPSIVKERRAAAINANG